MSSAGQNVQTFTEIERLVEEKIRNGEKGYLWLSDICEATFGQLTNESSSLTRHLRYLYYHDKGDLRIRMPSRFHEDLICQFHSLICDKLRSAGLLKTACMPCAYPLINLRGYHHGARWVLEAIRKL